MILGIIQFVHNKYNLQFNQLLEKIKQSRQQIFTSPNKSTIMEYVGGVSGKF